MDNCPDPVDNFVDNPGPVLVGEMNPYGKRPEFALYDEPAYSAGGRMRRLVCGLHPSTYRALSRHNLCVGTWDARRARVSADHLRAAYPGRVLVLLGRQVATAFGMQAVEPFTLARPCGLLVDDDTRMLVLPHPSGRCRAWNDPQALLQARVALHRACPDVQWGEADPVVVRR